MIRTLHPTSCVFSIQNDGQTVGVVRFSTDEDGRVWLSWEVKEQYRRQGFAADAARGLMGYLHRHGYSVAWALIRPWNEASRGLAAHLGGELVAEDDANETWRFKV